jgi:hypothetical protein
MGLQKELLIEMKFEETISIWDGIHEMMEILLMETDAVQHEQQKHDTDVMEDVTKTVTFALNYAETDSTMASLNATTKT